MVSMPLLLCLLLTVLGAQAIADELPNTDIVVFQLHKDGGGFQISDPQAVAQSSGYDNQPCFSADSKEIYFSRIENDQADIWRWSRSGGTENLTSSRWSEYSPTPIPGTRDLLSTVMVEDTGVQRLWTYSQYAGFQLLFPTVQPVGYHAWSGENVALFVLGVPHELQIAQWGVEGAKKIDRNIGRCLQKVPSRNAVSYTKLENKDHRLKIYDFDVGKISSLRKLPSESQDYAWLNESTILTWNGSSLVYGDARRKTGWRTLPSPQPLRAVTRLAVSPDGTQLAVVFEPEKDALRIKPETVSWRAPARP